MKKAALLLVLLAVSAPVIYKLASDRPPSRPPVLPGFQAPDFELEDDTGRPWRLSGMAGSVVFINFWASWCKECREEMPSIQRLYEMKKDDPRFHLITILYRDEPEIARKYLEENSYTFPMLIDPTGKAAYDYRLTGVPETFIINKGGMVAGKVIGPAEWDSPEIVGLITKLIEDSPEQAAR